MKKGECMDIFDETEGKWDPEGRFFAVDDTLAGVYSMFIRHLSQKDGGGYRCGVKTVGRGAGGEEW